MRSRRKRKKRKENEKGEEREKEEKNGNRKIKSTRKRREDEFPRVWKRSTLLLCNLLTNFSPP